MYNFWFAIEDNTSLLSLKKGIAGSEVNPVWFPAISQQKLPFPNLASAVSQAARRGSADALFYESSHQPLPPSGLVRRIPTLVSLDSAPAISPDNSDWTAPAGFVVWSEWAKAQLVQQSKIAPGRVLVARSGVDLGAWDTALNTFERARSHKTGLPARVRLLFMGDDFSGLGGETLLELLKDNPRLAESCELHLAVSRNTAATYFKSVSRPRNVQVHICAQPRHIPTELYVHADICVLPSHKPVSPSLVAKAMAAGLPIVASRIGGLPELVRDGQSGMLVEPGDQTGLVQALNTLVENPTRRQALGEGARSLAEAEFDAVSNTHKILTFMKQITAEARARTTGLAPDLRRFAVAPVSGDIHPNIEE